MSCCAVAPASRAEDVVKAPLPIRALYDVHERVLHLGAPYEDATVPDIARSNFDRHLPRAQKQLALLIANRERVDR
jgi:hypothetical protein